ncbi:MAG: hypothetical protein ABSG27_04895 [Candidatus Acidiferrales bacterium]|jgi:hypothetical protein
MTFYPPESNRPQGSGQRARVIWLFVAGAVFCFFALGLYHFAMEITGQESERTEEMRTTSPDGRFDAVMICEMYRGAVGGINWYVYIVPKGEAAPSDARRAVLAASDMTREKLLWTKPHLLQVQYDRAEIENFRNLWALDQVEDVGPSGDRDYFVEIRLAPSSPDFSLLTPEGNFRTEQQ